MTQAPAATATGDPDDKEFMTTLAKGLAVLGAFGRQRPTMTLSEAAAVADLSRATARRVLRTLTELGYVEQDGRRILAVAAHARARLRLSLDAELDRPRAAADEGAERAAR